VTVKEIAIESNTSNISPVFGFLNICLYQYLRAANLAGWGKIDAKFNTTAHYRYK
jgi:hypothetical protein